MMFHRAIVWHSHGPHPGISRDRAVILFMLHDSMSLTYFIPIVGSGSAD